MVQGSYLAYALEINHRLGNNSRAISSALTWLSSWAAKDWALYKNPNVRYFGCAVQSPVSEAQLCSRQSSRTCSPPQWILWKTRSLSPSGTCRAQGGRGGRKLEQAQSQGHCCEVWTFPLMAVESFAMLQIRVKYPPGVRCQGLWSDLLAGSLAGWRGLLRHFLVLSCAGSLLETSDEHSVWKNTENAVD